MRTFWIICIILVFDMIWWWNLLYWFIYGFFLFKYNSSKLLLYKIKYLFKYFNIIVNAITKTTIKRSNTLFLNESMYLGFETYKKFVSSKVWMYISFDNACDWNTLSNTRLNLCLDKHVVIAAVKVLKMDHEIWNKSSSWKSYIRKKMK